MPGGGGSVQEAVFLNEEGNDVRGLERASTPPSYLPPLPPRPNPDFCVLFVLAI